MSKSALRRDARSQGDVGSVFVSLLGAAAGLALRARTDRVWRSALGAPAGARGGSAARPGGGASAAATGSDCQRSSLSGWRPSLHSPRRRCERLVSGVLCHSWNTSEAQQSCQVCRLGMDFPFRVKTHRKSKSDRARAGRPFPVLRRIPKHPLNSILPRTLRVLDAPAMKGGLVGAAPTAFCRRA